MTREFVFHTRGQTLALLDWANLFSTTRRRWKIDEKKLFEYFKKYPEISAVRLFAGEDTHQKSRDFLEKCRKIGFEVVTKKVKYMKDRRKCDFDVEITMAMILGMSDFETFLLFSGDGDYAPVVKYLLKKGKRVFVIAEKRSFGREFFEMSPRPILLPLKIFRKKIEKTPNAQSLRGKIPATAKPHL